MTVETFKQQRTWTKDTKVLADILLRTVFGAEAKELSLLYFLWTMNSAGGAMNMAEHAQQDKLLGGANQLSTKVCRFVKVF
jgi:hypothetical protein